MSLLKRKLDSNDRSGFDLRPETVTSDTAGSHELDNWRPGVAPHDPTNSHRAVVKLKALGFYTRDEGKSVLRRWRP
jgi:hypothetical protein